MKKFLILFMALTLGWCYMSAVSLTVQVPNGTKKCFICGDFNSWDASSCPQMTSNGDNTFSIDLPNVSTSDLAKGYKYLCGQDWAFVEKDASGGEISNRTSYGNPDKVASWASTNNWDIKKADLTINGIPRQIHVYLPEGHENSSDTYPVIYYNTVQQRYNNAGADNDNGDHFLGEHSWNAMATMENLRESSNQAYILVQIPSMLGENTVAQHPDYKGTGDADLYLDQFLSVVMPYIESNYPVKKGKENTTIIGADYGALFSLYAAVSKPDIFGTAVVMSPMLWINEGYFEALAANTNQGQTFYVSVGDREPDWMKNDTKNLAEILKQNPNSQTYYSVYKGAAHNDDDWGKSFTYILSALPELKDPLAGNGDNNDDNGDDNGDNSDDDLEFSQKTYTLFAGSDINNLNLSYPLSYIEEYYKNNESTPTEAFVVTYPISTDYKKDFFWNIKKKDGSWVLSEPKKIGFSSSKTETSWHNVVLFPDESTQNVAAHSKGFRVIVGDKTFTMTQDTEYKSKATVTFGDIKDFYIIFGSVNSNSPQPALTPTISVSENCTKAEITYDFNLNKVTVEETVVDDNNGEEEEEEEDKNKDFASMKYTLYAGPDKDAPVMNYELKYTQDYYKGEESTPTEAFVVTYPISTEYKKDFFWNIKYNENGEDKWLLSESKKIGFSSSKTETSWHTVAVFENGSTENVAAHSKGFRVIVGSNTFNMTQDTDYKSKATVTFGDVKDFYIIFGSVNSNSPQPALTPTISVSDNCTQADITYDFNLNKVTVEETVVDDNNGEEEEEDEDKNKDFASMKYTLYAGPDKDAPVMNYELKYTQDYYKVGESTSTEAFVVTYPISTDYKKDFFWNIKYNENGEDKWLLSESKKIGFSSSKTETSWHTVAVFEDGSTENVAAHSKGFLVIVGDKTFKMTQDTEYKSKASVTFGDVKDFVIKFGSVNSNSPQTALTPTISVSQNCTQADITYDFNLNKVTVVETMANAASVGATRASQADFQLGSYSVYGGENADDLKLIGAMTFSSDFRKIGSETPLEAFIYTNDIPASYQSVYYWNIKDNESGNWMISSPKKIEFKSSKTETSWHTIALFADGTTSDVAAHSKGFRVVKGGNTTMMNPGSNHTATLTVAFPTYDKEFQINYGSVNTSNDMGPITPSFQVSNLCLEADIVYDFSLNKVTVTETRTGSPDEVLKVVQFTVLPAVAKAGTDVTGKIVFNKPCTNLNVNCKKLSGSSVPVSVTTVEPNEYTFTLTNTTEGIYNISLSYSDGKSTYSNMNPIDVRILAAGNAIEPELTVNAYDGVDWNSIGRYKANFHTHTSQSFDTQYTTTEVVDKYQAAGYKILALTDHDANTFPWNMFSLYNPDAQDRYAETMGMLPIPGNELSKDRRNNWSESTGGEFNHHNDFFTGRKGQEFMSLRESYAYTQALGGLQIINHPGQYWSLDKEYKDTDKNSPQWHATNFTQYESLIGLEVYNQGNRRPNDRILWDQVLTITMPERPVWGYSCDDTHTSEQYFRNYQYMLMPTLTVDDLKEAMINGNTVFSYEFTGSGKAKAPYINSIEVDTENHTIYIDTDNAENIEWIYSTYRSGSAASSTKSAIVGYGKSFDYSGYQGSYVRARLTNAYGETATQPFGFTAGKESSVDNIKVEKESALRVINIPGKDDVTLICTDPMIRISVFNSAGAMVKYMEVENLTQVSFSKVELPAGVYVVVVATPDNAYTAKFLR